MNTMQGLFRIVIFVGFLLTATNAGVTDQLLGILKRFIQTPCKCSPYHCCSKWGYCGLADAYCGEGCQTGPCKTRFTRSHNSFNMTPELFQCVFPNLNTDLRTRRFQGLLEAMTELKWKPNNATEVAIFLAHVSYETNGLQSLSEECVEQNTCDNYQVSWCSIRTPLDLKYHGRGMLKLSYPCNYYHAGEALGIDLLNNPDLVQQSDKIAAATAIWYYKEAGVQEFAQQGHFAGTTERLNKQECSNDVGYDIQIARVKIYQHIRKCFNLPKASENLIC